MATKRARTTKKASTSHASSALVPLEKQRFTSNIVRNDYKLIFTKKSIVFETGIVLPITSFPNIELISSGRGWSQFFQLPVIANTTIVREFYAALKNTIRGEHVTVQDCFVDISGPTINAMYGLHPTIPHLDEDGEATLVDDYTEFLKNPEMSKIYNVICRDGHDDPKQTGFGTIVTRCLSLEARTWLYIINSRLMPTTNINECTLDHQLLIFAIMSGLSINIGQLISGQMKYASNTKKVNICFPSLISTLCERAGVDNLEGDRFESPTSLINDRFVKNLLHRESRATTTPSNALPSSNQPGCSTQNDDMRTRLESVEKKIDVYQRHSTMYCRHLDAMIRALVIATNPNTHLPPFPTIEGDDGEAIPDA